MNENEPNEGAELVHRVAREWLDETAVVPLSILALDLEPPVAGWAGLLEARGIELLEDDLLRPSIRREDARRLAQERRDWERQSAEKARRRQESLEAPPVAVGGVPAIAGATPLESLQANDPGYTTVEQEFGRGGSSVFTQLLDAELAQGRRQERDKREQAEVLKKARKVIEEEG